MKWHWEEDPIPYTGAELRSHWIRERFGLAGDACVGFRGPCDVQPEHIIDMEERQTGARIAGNDMVHFLCEHFLVELREITLRQRLLACIANEVLRESASLGDRELTRQGDDLFLGAGKLSISIATVSPVSGLIHFAVNVTTDGVPAPVKAAGLQDIHLDPEPFGRLVMKRYVAEMDSAEASWMKVRPTR